MLLLASWAISPPHGVYLDTDVLEDITSAAAWPAVGVLVVLLAYATVRVRLARVEDPETRLNPEG